jgi:hypothetical protein
MSGLFTLLRSRVDRNARHAVEVYADELPEYRAIASNCLTQADMLHFAALLRRREAELAAEGQPFTEADLGILRAYGEERGASGVSLLSQQRVLVLHSVLTLQEIQEAAGPNDSDHLMHMLGWLPVNGLAAQNAYTEGYLSGQKRFLPVVRRVQGFARMLLAGNSAINDAATSLGMPLAARYAVVVVRIPHAPFADAGDRRDEIVEAVLKDHQVPITWHEPGELVALFPAGETVEGDQSEFEGDERPMSLVRDFSHMVGRPCAVGAAVGRVGELGDALALARRVSEAAPVQAVPAHLHTVSDLFVELGVKHLPGVEQWLRGLGERLSAGPDLVHTLDVFYRHRMNRLLTAGALRIHPRTLDYRLHRVRELVGIEPGSVRGVRVLSTTITMILSGTWTR